MIRLISKGFTIVELLIAIVVIAVLAVIAIAVYGGIQSQARISVAKADLEATAKEVEIYKIDNSSYPSNLGPDDATWKAILSKTAGDISDGTKKSFVLCRYTDGLKYAIVAWSPINPSAGETMYFVSSASEGVSSMTYPGQGGHPTIAYSACVAALGASGGLGPDWSFML